MSVAVWTMFMYRLMRCMVVLSTIQQADHAGQQDHRAQHAHQQAEGGHRHQQDAKAELQCERLSDMSEYIAHLCLIS